MAAESKPPPKRERTKWETGCFFRNAEALTGYLEQASDVQVPFVPVHTESKQRSRKILKDLSRGQGT